MGGLDARAWRLPRHDKSITVYEVDVQTCISYKTQKMAQLQLPLPCTRVMVEADLSKPSWSTKLISAGFQPSEPSFFLIEGLLMYLPPHAPRQLLTTVAQLMSKGSTVAGDCMVNYL